eukprot:scaffold33568_cov51-Isochrysis_galbana.AAC.1
MGGGLHTEERDDAKFRPEGDAKYGREGGAKFRPEDGAKYRLEDGPPHRHAEKKKGAAAHPAQDGHRKGEHTHQQWPPAPRAPCAIL